MKLISYNSFGATDVNQRAILRLKFQQTGNREVNVTSWLRCHRFLSLLYMDFFVTGTGTLCFLAYSIASSLPIISHSLQGSRKFSLGFGAKNGISKQTRLHKIASETVSDKKNKGTQWVIKF